MTRYELIPNRERLLLLQDIKSDFYIFHLFANRIILCRVTIFGIDGESIFDSLSRKFQTKPVQLLRVAAVDGGDNSISSL